MAPRRQRRRTPDLETNTPPDELRRQDRQDSTAETPNEYERELDRLDAATSTRH